jgi:hypothetical protein
MSLARRRIATSCGRPTLCGAVVVLALVGCSGEIGLNPSSPARVGIGGGVASAGPAARVGFQLAAEGLPIEGRWKSTPAVADVNKDGFPDIAAHIRLGNGARVWLGNGQGVWRDSSRGLRMKDQSCGGAVQFGDVNNDGILDLAVADHCNGVYVYLGDGKGGWQVVTEKLDSALSQQKAAEDGDGNMFSGAEAVALGDVNADGFLDIVACASDRGAFTVYAGDGSGKNWKEVKGTGLPSAENPEKGDVAGAGWCNDVHLADMNNDGHLDVVAGYYNGPRVWRGDGKGHFASHSVGLTKSRLGGLYRKVAVGDINGDGLPDLVVANFVNGVEAYLQNPDGTWREPIDVMPALKGGATAVALGDLDGDGNVDVVIAGQFSRSARSGHGLFIRLGDGKGGFVDAVGTNLPDKGLEVVWGMVLVDMDGDGRLDIVATSGGETGKAAVPTQGVGGETGGDVPRVQVWRNQGARASR